MLGGEPAAAAAPAAPATAAAAAPAAPKKEGFQGLGGLEHCPDFNERFTLRNGRTGAIAYPKAGYNCTEEYGLVQAAPAGPASELGGATAAPAKAAAPAKKAPAAPQSPQGAPNLDNLEHCPDFNERFTLRNGTTAAVPYPKAGINCNPAWSLV